MDTDSCRTAVVQYIQAIRGDFSTYDHELGCAIVTPFIRPDGDYVELLAEKRPNGQVILSDMGETFAYLYLSGLSLSRKLQDDAKRIGGRHGISLNVNELIVETDEDHVGQALHRLLQAVLGVSALIEKRRPDLNLRFEEEVEAVVIAQGKLYDPDYQVPGSREPHVVKFHVDSGLNLLIQPLSQATEIQARRVTERWNYYFNDIKAANSDWSCVAVLDDRGDRQSIWANPHTTIPLQGVATMVRWSEKDRFVGILEGPSVPRSNKKTK
ncbi:MAG: DUF1828 domain-containing protein [Dehalococcoidia bacterium]|nr:DUF1828 domain-containing protein [Dehalococcoidia bacterium]